MLYELLPVLRGWKPDQTSSLVQTINKNQTIPIIDDNTAGWLQSLAFRSSDASCKITLTLDHESYEEWFIAHFEPPSPMPFHNYLKVEVSLSDQSSQNSAFYDVILNRIVIVDKEDFLLSVRELLYGKWGQLFDQLSHKPLIEIIKKEAQKLGVKITKEDEKEKVLPELRRYQR